MILQINDVDFQLYELENIYNNLMLLIMNKLYIQNHNNKVQIQNFDKQDTLGL